MVWRVNFSKMQGNGRFVPNSTTRSGWRCPAVCGSIHLYRRQKTGPTHYADHYYQWRAAKPLSFLSAFFIMLLRSNMHVDLRSKCRRS